MKNRAVRFLLTINLVVGAILVSHSATFHSVDAQTSIKSASKDAELPDDQINQIREKIHDYIAMDERLKGCFLLIDSARDKVLRLKFDLLPAPIRHVQETLEGGELRPTKLPPLSSRTHPERMSLLISVCNGEDLPLPRTEATGGLLKKSALHSRLGSDADEHIVAADVWHARPFSATEQLA